MTKANETLKEAQLKDYEDRFIPQAESVFQFLGVLTGDSKRSYDLAKASFASLLENFHRSSEHQDARLVSLKAATEQFLAKKIDGKGLLSKLAAKEKVAVALSDSFGLSVEEISEALGCELVTTRTHLAKGRRQLLSIKLQDGNKDEQNTVVGYISDYLDDDIPTQKLKEFKKALAVVEGVPESELSDDNEKSKVVSSFLSLRQKLAGERAGFSLNLDQMENIRTLAEEPISILAREHKAIGLLSAAESQHTILRWTIAGLLCSVLVLGAVVGQSRIEQKAKEFDPLLYLGNETEAFEYDYRNRLDFPVRGLEEVHSFLTTRKSALGHSPVVLSPPMRGVNVLGASVLDYDPRKVSAVLYLDERSADIAESSPEVVALYCYDGSFRSLAQAPKKAQNGISFQTYTSDRYNMVAFENGDETICMLMGRMSGSDLLNMASQRY